MNKTAVTVVAITSISALVAWYLYLQHGRYQVVGTQEGVAYEVDRHTGKSWTLYPGGEKVENEDTSSTSKDKEWSNFSDSDKALVTGNASLGYGSFSGKIYNGSERTVRQVVFSVAARETNGMVRWTRKFRHPILVRPLSTSDFSITVTGDRDIGSTVWGIMEIYGN